MTLEMTQKLFVYLCKIGMLYINLICNKNKPLSKVMLLFEYLFSNKMFSCRFGHKQQNEGVHTERTAVNYRCPAYAMSSQLQLYLFVAFTAATPLMIAPWQQASVEFRIV